MPRPVSCGNGLLATALPSGVGYRAAPAPDQCGRRVHHRTSALREGSRTRCHRSSDRRHRRSPPRGCIDPASHRRGHLPPAVQGCQLVRGQQQPAPQTSLPVAGRVRRIDGRASFARPSHRLRQAPARTPQRGAAASGVGAVRVLCIVSPSHAQQEGFTPLSPLGGLLATQPWNLIPRRRAGTKRRLLKDPTPCFDKHVLSAGEYGECCVWVLGPGRSCPHADGPSERSGVRPRVSARALWQFSALV